MNTLKTLVLTGLILFIWALEPGLDGLGATVTTEKEIAGIIQEYVAEQLTSRIEDIRVRRLAPTNGRSIQWPGKVIGIRAGSKGRLLGRALFIVSIENEDQRSRSFWVSAEVDRIHNIVVASRSLKRHQVLHPDDLSMKTISVTHSRNRYILHPEILIGKRLTRTTGKGVPIRSDLVEETPVILRGDRVTILLESGGLRIMTTGKAKEDGFPGKTISVQNLDSRLIVYGRVVESGLVKVSFNVN